MLKDYSVKKIEKKLELLMERRNIKSPASWLRTTLKNDYRGEEQESRPTPHPHLNASPLKGKNSIEYIVRKKQRKKWIPAFAGMT